MKRRTVAWLIVVLLVFSLAFTAAVSVPTVWLKANQSVIVRCVDQTGEIMVEFHDDGEAEITCRVWVR